MSLVLKIALGYAIGRELHLVWGTLAKVIVRRIVERSTTLQRWMREDSARDTRLKGQIS